MGPFNRHSVYYCASHIGYCAVTWPIKTKTKTKRNKTKKQKKTKENKKKEKVINIVSAHSLTVKLGKYDICREAIRESAKNINK